MTTTRAFSSLLLLATLSAGCGSDSGAGGAGGAAGTGGKASGGNGGAGAVDPGGPLLERPSGDEYDCSASRPMTLFELPWAGFSLVQGAEGAELAIVRADHDSPDPNRPGNSITWSTLGLDGTLGSPNAVRAPTNQFLANVTAARGGDESTIVWSEAFGDGNSYSLNSLQMAASGAVVTPANVLLTVARSGGLKVVRAGAGYALLWVDGNESSTKLSFGLLDEQGKLTREPLVIAQGPYLAAGNIALVGGTITEELQTPLAHVNVAARARGTPNLALRGASSDPRILPFLDQLVRFEVAPAGFSIQGATLDDANAYWESRVGEPLVPEADDTFSGLPDFEELGFADALRVGVKAANLSELKHLLGDTAPSGFAVPFSAYHTYMSENRVTDALCGAARADCVDEGRSAALCAAAGARCAASAAAADTYYGLLQRLLADPELSADTALRDASLNDLRYLVHNGTVDPDFALALDARVAELFGERKVRLRSSTNAEDLPNFTGAGLYESLSAFATGNQRASARIREVWASVFSFRAFEERALWNVEHRAVRMAVAVDAAVDDEVANGVLITRNLAKPGSQGLYVNVQQGEVEVTNPENGAVPEIFSIVPGPSGGVQVVRQRFSSLSRDASLLEDTEVTALADAAQRVHAHFAALYGGKSGEFALDLEFKFHGPSRQLLVKQARPYVTD